MSVETSAGGAGSASLITRLMLSPLTLLCPVSTNTAFSFQQRSTVVARAHTSGVAGVHATGEDP